MTAGDEPRHWVGPWTLAFAHSLDGDVQVTQRVWVRMYEQEPHCSRCKPMPWPVYGPVLAEWRGSWEAIESMLTTIVDRR